jgi:hypothetical protein
MRLDARRPCSSMSIMINDKAKKAVANGETRTLLK